MPEELNGSAVVDETQATQTTSTAPETASGETSASRQPNTTLNRTGIEQVLSAGDGDDDGLAHTRDDGGTQTTVQPSFLEQLSEFGEEFQGVTDEMEARNRLLAHAKAVREERQRLAQWQQQAAPYVRAGQQYAAIARDPEYQAWLAQKQAARQQPGAQPAPQAPQQPEKWWNPPAFDKNTLADCIEHVVDPATGGVVPRFKADTPVEVRSAYAAHQKYLNEWQDGLSTRPHEVLPAIIKQEVAPLIEQYFAQREEQARAQQFVAQVNEQNATWLYQTDANGQPLFDPVSREPLFTEAGARARQNVAWLESIGVTDPQQRWFLATSLLHRDALLQATQQTAQQQQVQQTNSDVAAQKKAEAVGKGRNFIANRGGSQPRPQSSKPLAQNARMSPGQQFQQLMEQQGMGSVPLAQMLRTQP